MNDEHEPNLTSMENTVGLENIRARSKSIAEDIGSMDIANLLSEDLERSRNILIALTTISMSLNLVEIDSFELLGISAHISSGGRFIVTVFIICISILAALYYKINFDTDIVSKGMKVRVLKERIQSEEVFLAHASQTIAQSKNSTAKIEGEDPQIEENAQAEREEIARIVSSGIISLKQTHDEFQRQKSRIETIPDKVILGCIGFQLLAWYYRAMLDLHAELSKHSLSNAPHNVETQISVFGLSQSF